MLNSKRHLLRAEKRMAQVDCRGEAFPGVMHHADQAGPIDLCRALQLPRPGIAESRNVGNDQDVADVVESATTSAAKHLQEFLGQQVSLEAARLVAGVGDEHAAQGKIDARREAGRCDDGAELPRLGQRLDDASAQAVAQAAMMKRHAPAQQGATDLIDPGAGDPVEQIRERTAGRGTDYAIEVVGTPETITTAYNSARRGGIVTVVGMPAIRSTVSFPGLGLFLEGRYVSVFQPGDNFNFIPVSLGLRF